MSGDGILGLAYSGKKVHRVNTDGRQVTVRVAVSVDPDGEWSAVGWSDQDEDAAHSFTLDHIGDNQARYWLTATLDVPEVPEIEAAVSTDSEQGGSDGR